MFTEPRNDDFTVTTGAATKNRSVINTVATAATTRRGSAHSLRFDTSMITNAQVAESATHRMSINMASLPRSDDTFQPLDRSAVYTEHRRTDSSSERMLDNPQGVVL
jgi:DNA helicase TIP49 (TBP-interacting protein)